MGRSRASSPNVCVAGAHDWPRFNQVGGRKLVGDRTKPASTFVLPTVHDHHSAGNFRLAGDPDRPVHVSDPRSSRTSLRSIGAHCVSAMASVKDQVASAAVPACLYFSCRTGYRFCLTRYRCHHIATYQAVAVGQLVLGKVTGLHMCVRIVVMGSVAPGRKCFDGGTLLSFTSKIHCERASDEHVK